MKKVELWGYTIYENGTIKNEYGNTLVPRKQIKIKWKNSKSIFISYARFVYYAFNQKAFSLSDKKIVIVHKNGNENDYHIDNLVAIKRKEVIQNENNAYAKLTNKQVEEIKELYSNKKNNDTSYRKLAEIYGVSHTLIRGIVLGIFRNEDNYILK